MPETFTPSNGNAVKLHDFINHITACTQEPKKNISKECLALHLQMKHESYINQQIISGFPELTIKTLTPITM